MKNFSFNNDDHYYYYYCACAQLRILLINQKPLLNKITSSTEFLQKFAFDVTKRSRNKNKEKNKYSRDIQFTNDATQSQQEFFEDSSCTCD